MSDNSRQSDTKGYENCEQPQCSFVNFSVGNEVRKLPDGTCDLLSSRFMVDAYTSPSVRLKFWNTEGSSMFEMRRGTNEGLSWYLPRAQSLQGPRVATQVTKPVPSQRKLVHEDEPR